MDVCGQGNVPRDGQWCCAQEVSVGMGRDRCEERTVFISCISKECVAMSVICFDVVYGVGSVQKGAKHSVRQVLQRRNRVVSI